MSQDDVDRIVEFTNQILDSSGLDLRASAEETDGSVRIELTGSDKGVLLGHNAELLDALEYLGNRLVARNRGEESHIPFDSGNYRLGREKELKLMAAKAAEKVESLKGAIQFRSDESQRTPHCPSCTCRGYIGTN